MRLCSIILPLWMMTAALAHLQAAQSADATAAPLTPAYTLKAGTQIVVVDVVVKDKQGANVHNLKAADFSLAESGKPQQLRSFEEHASPATVHAAQMPQPPQLPPGEFTNYVAVPQSGALNVILYDTTNTALKDQAYMHAQLIEYLKQARPDAGIAIFALGTHVVQVQGFTSNPATLLTAPATSTASTPAGPR